MYVLNLTGMDPGSDHPSTKTIPVCFNKYNLKILEDYAKKNGMLDYNQAVEYLAKKTPKK